MQRLRQIAATFNATRAADPRLVPLMAAWSGGILLALVLLGVLVLDSPVLYSILGVLAGLLAAIVVLGRRAQRVAFARIEGQPGAAAAVLQSMRGPWRVTPAVAFNARQDIVHRVIGRPGVVLVAEGASGARVRELLGKERRRTQRAAGDVAVRELVVGDGDGQVPLSRLALHMARLPRTLKPRDVGPLDRKLGALKQSDLPMPKGPMPRPPRGKYR